MRDVLLRTLDRPFFQILGLLVLFAVVVDGALFFFFLMGWQSLCVPVRDCEPRNQIYNISVQILNGLFTYMAVASMPWRCTNALHIFGLGCPRRSNEIGRDLYGLASDDIWYHLPLGHRKSIILVLMLNCLFQFANQATRIVYWNYALQNVTPGNIWTNVFFVASMLMAAVGGVWMAVVSEGLRRQSPARFGPGPLQTIQPYFRWCSCCKKGDKSVPDETNEPEPVVVDAMRVESERTVDPTREPQNRTVLGGTRSELRLFAL